MVLLYISDDFILLRVNGELFVEYLFLIDGDIMIKIYYLMCEVIDDDYELINLDVIMVSVVNVDVYLLLFSVDVIVYYIGDYNY